MSKSICFQDGERKIFVSIHPLTEVLLRRVSDKLRRKESIRITDQSDLYEKLKLNEAILREVIESVEIQDNGADRRGASSIEANELFFGERSNPKSLILDEATAYAKAGDQEVKKVEGN